MKNLSLSTRLFLSCFGISALLFCGIFFYLKGFSENQERREGERLHRLAVERLHEVERKLGTQVTTALADPGGALWKGISAELSNAGLHLFACRACENHDGLALGFEFRDGDRARFDRERWLEGTTVKLSTGPWFVRALPAERGAISVFLLSPLANFHQATAELFDAFLVGGIILLFLTGVVAQILAREIARPLIALRNRVRSMAAEIGLDPPPERGDEIREIAGSYLDFAQHVQTAFEHKKLALEELEAYKGELLRVNSNLHRRLFQVKVLLSLWSERDRALDVKDFLSRFLEALLPGLPFEFGCVIIRPLADMGSETIFAKKLAGAAAREGIEETADKGGTLWTDIIDPEVKEFLLRESQTCMETHSVRMASVLGCMRPGVPPIPLTVLSFRLKQGEEPLGSVHFLTEQATPAISVGLNEFLLNLSAQVSAQLQIQALSFATRLDPLTRLYNRGYLNDRLREEVVRCSRKREPFSVVLLDIDHFTRVNAEHGQQAADEILRGVASMLKSSCRGSDAVCRFAGPVLAIVLADTPISGAKIFAENVRKAVESHGFAIPGGSLRITVSLGIAEFPTDGDGVEALLAQADHALMNAKESGRNTWRSAA